MPDDCIFCRIARKEIPAQVVFEDDEFLAFRDIHPQAPLHAVLVPRAHIATLADCADATQLGRLMQAAHKTAEAGGVAASGYRVVVNYGRDGGQEVQHIHLHVLGGRIMGWPPG